MRRLLYILIFTLAASSVAAQQMPERHLVRKGNRQFKKEHFDRSVDLYTRALAADSTSFEAGYNLSNALFRSERYDKAEQTMMRAAADSTRSDIERAEAFYNLGNTQFMQKKLEQALESYRNSLRLNPSDMEAKYNYAYTKHLLDQQKNDQNSQNQNKNQNQNKDQNKDQNQNQDQNKDQNQDQNQNQNQDQNRNGDDRQDQRNPDDNRDGEGGEQPREGSISPQEQEAMLDAIQAQEDKTQEKVKEKQGVIVRGTKNW